jgi:hypothetical protein
MRHLKLFLLHLPFLVVSLYYAVTSPSTGGNGDTLYHFFYAAQAPLEPIYYFHLWAKPFFTLAASPFAYFFGFAGIKVFNVLCGTGAVYLTTLIAQKLNLRYYFLTPIVAFAAPAFPFFLQSGLTEPFGALLLAGVVLLFLYEKPLPAYILISFLPYVRSEAKIFILLFLAYGIINKHYRYLPLMALGTVFYALVGGFFKGTVFWILDSPYASGPSPYGSGPWDHFIQRLFTMLALPAFVLLCVGLLLAIYKVVTQAVYRKKEMWLIPGLFLSLFTAHSTVWALGIFASAGLERVLLIVFPMAWILILQGLELLVYPIKQRPWLGHSLVAAFLVLQVVFFYTSKTMRYYRHMALHLMPHQELVHQKIGPFIAQMNITDGLKLITDEGYLGVFLNKNPINKEDFLHWNTIRNNQLDDLSTHTLVLWDSYSVPIHQGITLKDLQKKQYLIEEKTWKVPQASRKYVLFSVQKPSAE